ncbi:MAG: pantetheine-phosphate adenylyltransferase [Planctomycetes bacterium]|nr:pantetheine-phosphate adenylyltransferase [Phycisphaerae bacterium]NBB94229.1 pantetheine-phosphate adenylyltransferase [Planctomycetota bacterium]
MSDSKRIALFPGAFDPMTNGHVDVIRRGVKLFDELVVGVGENPEKTALLAQTERVEIIREVVGDEAGVRIEAFRGLTVDFARQIGATAILRGIRNLSDLQFEFQVGLTNRVVANVETVFIMTNPEYAFTSSSLIKQIARQGGDVSALVPAAALPHLSPLAGNGNDSGLDEGD